MACWTALATPEAGDLACSVAAAGAAGKMRLLWQLEMWEEVEQCQVLSFVLLVHLGVAAVAVVAAAAAAGAGAAGAAVLEVAAVVGEESLGLGSWGGVGWLLALVHTGRASRLGRCQTGLAAGAGLAAVGVRADGAGAGVETAILVVGTLCCSRRKAALVHLQVGPCLEGAGLPLQA